MVLKNRFFRFLFLVLGLSILVSAELFSVEDSGGTQMTIVVDGQNLDTEINKLWRGAGMVSANNSSRLLLDYKAENPEKYWEILNYLFGDEGVSINHLKVEMGADVNSSSGTEPCVMRFEDEVPDVTRGAGFILAKDAQTVNPSLTLDMLWWGEPYWIKDDGSLDKTEVYSRRYKWYKATLDQAYKTFGLKFDYVSATQNERGVDERWIIYLSKHLKEEKDCPYEYSKIKIVAADEVCTWKIADDMLSNKELLNAVDVIGSHYTSWSTDNAKKLVNEYGKEAWFTEASSPMTYSQGAFRFDKKYSGMDGLNSPLDVANRIITMYSGGLMTLYEYQPAVAAYYDGVNYCQKQLILANTPWNGDYLLDSGFFMSLHFSQFIKKGWAMAPEACYADGKAGGDGHAIVKAKYSYMTAVDPVTKDFSTVITNTRNTDLIYNFSLSNLKDNAQVYVWETRGPDSKEVLKYDVNYFKRVQTITPSVEDGRQLFTLSVKPKSIVTVTTVDLKEKAYPSSAEPSQTLKYNEEEILALPYKDDYEYSDYNADYLSSRGNAPRYTTDGAGAFEVVQDSDGKKKNNYLMQKITTQTQGEEWVNSPNPITTFGDDRWFNYSFSSDIMFSEDAKEDDYIGLGIRCNYSCPGINGYWIKLCSNGDYSLLKGYEEVEYGSISRFKAQKWNNIKIEVQDNEVSVKLNGKNLTRHLFISGSLLSAGRAVIYSSYTNNKFDNVDIEPLKRPYMTRFDETDVGVNFRGSWDHNLMSGFKDYKRTSSTGSENAKVSFTFEGTGFSILGTNKGKSLIDVKVDGAIVDKDFKVPGTGARETAYYKFNLKYGEHKVDIVVKSDTFTCDGIEVLGK